MCSDSDIALMRDWLKKQKHLPQDVDDNYIRNFIVSAKNSLQAAKTKYEKFHMLRHLLDRDGIQWDPFSPENQGFIDRVALVRLPKKSPEGYTIYISRLLDPNDPSEPDDKHTPKWVALFYMNILCSLWDDELGDCQMIMINDWSGLKLAHCKGATPVFLRDFASAINGGVPLRIKGSHEVGLSSVLEFIINTVNSLIPKKLRQRRFAHSKIEGLYEHVPQEYLPSDYGGTQPSIAELHKQQKEVYKRHLDRLVKQKELVAAEKPFVPAELNIESADTFKKLDID